MGSTKRKIQAICEMTIVTKYINSNLDFIFNSSDMNKNHEYLHDVANILYLFIANELFKISVFDKNALLIFFCSK